MNTLKTLIAVAVLASFSGTAFAQEGAPAGNEGSIFTPPSVGEGPAFQKRGGFHKRGKGGGFRGQRGKHVGWHQIQMLPSLTPNQRKEIKDIYQQAKAEIQPDVQQIRAMKGEFKGKGPDGLSPENKEKFSSIKTRLQAKRENVWQQVKAKLTAQQLEELQKMRAGELKPPAVRDNQDG